MMFTTMREAQEIACNMLKKIRDNEIDYYAPDIPEPYYGYVIEYITYERFVTGLYGIRNEEGKFIVSDPFSPRITRRGLAFIRSMEKQR